MGLGYAMSEGFPCDADGMPENLTLRSLDIIRPKDMPPVDVILVEATEDKVLKGHSFRLSHQYVQGCHEITSKSNVHLSVIQNNFNYAS